MSLVLSLWLRACVLVAVGLEFADASMPNKPAGEWVRGPLTGTDRPYWNGFSCDDLTGSMNDGDYGRQFALGSEGWAYSVIYCTNEAAASLDIALGVDPFRTTKNGKIEMIRVGVNMWLHAKLMTKNAQGEASCSAHHIKTAVQFADYMHYDTSTDRIPTCKPDCPKGQQFHLTDAQPNSKTCLLTQGHVSITPVQGDLGFTVKDWRGDFTSKNVCQRCVVPSDECVIKQKT